MKNDPSKSVYALMEKYVTSSFKSTVLKVFVYQLTQGKINTLWIEGKR